MIYSWFSINLQNQRSMYFLSSSPSTRNGWTTQGLREDMYQHAVEKIRYQLESQGFTNIADFSKWGDSLILLRTPFTLVGWVGWLLTRPLILFLSNPTPAPTYHLNERFFSKDWATYDGDVKEFQ